MFKSSQLCRFGILSRLVEVTGITQSVYLIIQLLNWEVGWYAYHASYTTRAASTLMGHNAPVKEFTTMVA